MTAGRSHLGLAPTLLKYTWCAAALVECGFMDNRESLESSIFSMANHR